MENKHALERSRHHITVFNYIFQTYDVSKTKLACNPTFGKPSPDTHPLRDDEASTDRPMLTTFVDTPAKHLPVENGEVKAQKTGEGELVWNFSQIYLFCNAS